MIVTGDRAMLGLRTYQEIRILSLRQFLDEFAAARPVNADLAAPYFHDKNQMPALVRNYQGTQ